MFVLLSLCLVVVRCRTLVVSACMDQIFKKTTVELVNGHQMRQPLNEKWLFYDIITQLIRKQSSPLDLLIQPFILECLYPVLNQRWSKDKQDVSSSSPSTEGLTLAGWPQTIPITVLCSRKKQHLVQKTTKNVRLMTELATLENQTGSKPVVNAALVFACMKKTNA